MARNISFKDIRNYLKKHDNHVELEVIDKLADAAIIFAPFISAEFVFLWGLLDVKDRFINLGKTLLDCITSIQEPDYIERATQIKVAYSLICYTAFFDTLAKELPSSICKKLIQRYKKDLDMLELTPDDKKRLYTEKHLDVYCDIPYTDQVTPFSETIVNLKELYDRASVSIFKEIQKSEVFSGKEGKKKLDNLEKVLEELPNKAASLYKAQYLYLASAFNDFGFFAQELEFEALRQMAKQQQSVIEYIADVQGKIDFGLSNLYKIVNSIPTSFVEIQSQDIVSDLKAAYKATIEQPIIDNKEITSRDEEIRLNFPRMIDAFIPQSYKCLAYTTKSIRLEDEATWNDYQINNDLDRFFLKYLYCPDSINYPLIILGHPGSGKSLLTKVLSAQLMSKSFTVIRVPLREVNADVSIDLLVEEQIKKVTNRPLQNGYGGFAQQFKEKPLLIILDGYDELLQAKGDVFAGYLEKARIFQNDQKQLNRPVQIIVTSRITLIDKAIVPMGSTVLRLLEFNEDQRNAWIEIWNKTNARYFQTCSPQIKPFRLPKLKNHTEKNSIIELSEQPLLLLMLALYDSEGNSLAQLGENLKRTELYHSLIRRFVRREKGRYIEDFGSMPVDEQEKLIENEMKRLGVVAIGMFNRRKLFILTKELDNDLNEFSSSRDASRNLKDSERLLGGFFFIHQSTAKDISASSDNSESAFEFLHNTFGEFLAADMILRFAVEEAQALDSLSKNPSLENEMMRKLTNPDGLCKDWYISLMFTPLFSRPVILEMIQEHASYVIKTHKISGEDFLRNFHIIIKRHLQIFLSTNIYPVVMAHDHGITSIPLLGYISIYTQNLIILASVLCTEGFVFNETEYGRGIDESSQQEILSEARPWDKLAYLWRTWFSEGNLTGLSVIFQAYREGNKVLVKCNDKFEAKSYNHPVDIHLCVSHTLADELSTGLAGLQSQNLSDILRHDDEYFSGYLKKSSVCLYFSFQVIVLHRILYPNAKSSSIDYAKINKVTRELMDIDVIQVGENNTIFFIEFLRGGLSRHVFYLSTIRVIPSYLLSVMSSHNSIGSTPCSMLAFMMFRDLQGSNYSDFEMNYRFMLNLKFEKHNTTRMDLRKVSLSQNTFEISREAREVGIYDEKTSEIDSSMIEILERGNIELEMSYKLFDHFFQIENLTDIIQTNILDTSRLLLIVANRDFDLSTDILQAVRTYFDTIFDLFVDGGLFSIDNKIVTNTVRLSITPIGAEYKRKLLDFLMVFFSSPKEKYLEIYITKYPGYIAELMELIPEIFDLEYIESVLERDVFCNIDVSISTYISYIKIWRLLFEKKVIRERSGRSRDQSDEVFDKFLINFINQYQCNFNRINSLSVTEFGELRWLHRITGDRHLGDILDKSISNIL